MDPPPRLPLLTSIGLVLLCGAAAAGVAIAELATCFRQTGDSLPVGTRVSAACSSPTTEAWLDRGLAVAAGIALVGVLVGYLARSRRTAVWSTWLSLGLLAVVTAWGFAVRDTVPATGSALLPISPSACIRESMSGRSQDGEPLGSRGDT
ncbi:MAG TPA: hypothetical protein VHZ31_09965 [Solirubrobacteraceae bacterium]|jgi:preprotein translocase subunit Sss1|nr:hypothetical protein [Solirubrobacteraceae bacterium]